MLRILVSGDRIWGTSAYSKVVHSICRGLRGLGHSVAHVPMARSMRGGKFGYQDILIYPSGNDPWNEDVTMPHYTDYKADMLITVKDTWVFNVINRYALNWSPITPVDHSPVSPSITSRLHTCFRVIAISRFGQRELRHAGIENVEYIPHDVDTKIYRPLEGKKAECKKLFYLDPDDFVAGIIALNRVRKMIPHMLRGYKLFRDQNPDVKSKLWLWTPVQPQVADEEALPGVADSGVNLLPEIMELGLGEEARWPDWNDIQKIGGLPDWNPNPDFRGGWDMVKMYNAMDVHLLASGGEGFGMTLLESQACMPSDESITTIKDVKQIKDICVGDELLFSSVIKTFERSYNGNLVIVKPKGLLSRRFTVDHPILTDKGWKKADELSLDDCVIIPRMPSTDDIDPQRSRFYGIYVGDGYMEHGAIVLCPRDREQAKEWAHLGIDVFGGAYIQKVSSRVKIPKILSTDLSVKAGKDAKNKRIPVEIFTSNIKSKKAFLKGLIESDGYIYESKEKLRLIITTTSRGLVDDLTILLASLGIHASIRIKRKASKGKILDRKVNLNECYSFFIYGNDAAFILDSSRKFMNRGCKRGFVDETSVFYKIEKLEKQPFRGKVHNFQTGDGVYGVPYQVHNCGVPVITTDYAAGPEVCGAGLTVRPSDYVVIRTPGARLAVPSVDDIARTLAKIYNADREKLAERARKFALRYDREVVLEKYWRPFLEKCELELKPHVTKEGVKAW